MKSYVAVRKRQLEEAEKRVSHLHKMRGCADAEITDSEIAMARAQVAFQLAFLKLAKAEERLGKTILG